MAAAAAGQIFVFHVGTGKVLLLSAILVLPCKSNLTIFHLDQLHMHVVLYLLTQENVVCYGNYIHYER